MNSLLQKHGCANVFTIPQGLKELLSDISREVLRDQPANILEYIANYLAALLITREHGLMAVKILEDLCDCKPTVEELLEGVGMSAEVAAECARIIQESFDLFDPEEGEKLQEKVILKKLMCLVELSLEQATAVCKILQDVYRDYWQKKQALQKTILTTANEPWEVAAQRTVDIYKTTRPTLSELVQATEKIQAAYRGYHVRREMMGRLRVKETEHVQSTTTTLDVAGSREIDLGPKMNIQMDGELGCIFNAEEGLQAPSETKQSPPRDTAVPSELLDTEMTPKLSTILSASEKAEGSRQRSRVSVGRPTSETVTFVSKENVESDIEDVNDHSRSEGDGSSGEHITAEMTSASVPDEGEQSGAETADEVTEPLTEEEAD